MVPEFEDILYAVENQVAIITINRPEVLNAFRVKTVNELIHAFRLADADPNVAAIIFTGAGDRAFSAGGDQKEREHTGHERDVLTGEAARDMELHAAIRNTGKPVIAAVNGYAIGGGHVLHVLCDISLASENAIFGQVGPKVGSFDAGYGTIVLARVIGEKRAREMWYFCRRYNAQEAYDMGLVNKVVPADQLMTEAKSWAAELVDKSPTALKFLKFSFNTDTAQAGGISSMAFAALDLYQDSDEAREGNAAFNEKRPVDYSPYRRQS